MRMGVSQIMLVLMGMFMRMRMFVRMTMVVYTRMIPSTGRPFLLAIHPDIYLGRRDATAIHARNLQPRSKIQRRHRPLQQFWRHARVDQGAQKHVAAHAGKTLKVSSAHGKKQLLALCP